MVKEDVMEFEDKIPLRYLANNPKFAAPEELLIDKELEEMLEKEIIKDTIHEEEEFLCTFSPKFQKVTQIS